MCSDFPKSLDVDRWNIRDGKGIKCISVTFICKHAYKPCLLIGPIKNPIPNFLLPTKDEDL